jgi:hypothetical protein
MVEPSLAIALFPTPIVVFDLPDMAEVNRELAAQLLAEEQTCRAGQRANVGGWHSAPDLSRRPQPWFRAGGRGAGNALKSIDFRPHAVRERRCHSFPAGHGQQRGARGVC